MNPSFDSIFTALFFVVTGAAVFSLSLVLLVDNKKRLRKFFSRWDKKPAPLPEPGFELLPFALTREQVPEWVKSSVRFFPLAAFNYQGVFSPMGEQEYNALNVWKAVYLITSQGWVFDAQVMLENAKNGVMSEAVVHYRIGGKMDPELRLEGVLPFSEDTAALGFATAQAMQRAPRRPFLVPGKGSL